MIEMICKKCLKKKADPKIGLCKECAVFQQEEDEKEISLDDDDDDDISFDSGDDD